MPRPLRFVWIRQYSRPARGERWLGGVVDHGYCAGVWFKRGWWRGEVWPRGNSVVGAYFASPDKAKRSIERWLTHHPDVADVVTDPRGETARYQARPLPWLAQYLREHPSKL